MHVIISVITAVEEFDGQDFSMARRLIASNETHKGVIAQWQNTGGLSQRL